MIQQVRILIKKEGFTNDYLSEHSGVGKSTISAITSEKESYKNYEIRNLDFIVWLFKRFPNLNAQWLFFGNEPMFLQEDDKVDMSEYIKRSELESVKTDVAELQKLMEQYIKLK